MIPYGKQIVDEDDVQAVVDVLKSDWLTTGPVVKEFETAFAETVNSRYAVSLSSGTAGLHAAMYAIGIQPDDEVIVPSMTFAATANCVVYQGGVPVFADVDPDTLLLDPKSVESKINNRTKAIICVDYAGQSCDYDTLTALARANGLSLVADACHSLGALYKGRRVGSLADMSVFSFHPVKHITSGEGGMVTCKDDKYSSKIRCFRNHGISTDHHQRTTTGTWQYEMTDLGYNYRLTDIQCALALSQLNKLPSWLKRRREIASRYSRKFKGSKLLRHLHCSSVMEHAYHLYVVRLCRKGKNDSRLRVFEDMRGKGIGVNVHYLPVHLHSYYQKKFGCKKGDCPVAESAYKEILSLPMYPGLHDSECDYVSDTLVDTLQNIAKE
jgi:perosamine synthetase